MWGVGDTVTHRTERVNGHLFNINHFAISAALAELCGRLSATPVFVVILLTRWLLKLLQVDHASAFVPWGGEGLVGPVKFSSMKF